MCGVRERELRRARISAVHARYEKTRYNWLAGARIVRGRALEGHVRQMDERYKYPPLSAVSTGLRCRCPRCGRGRLFSGYLTLAPSCGSCDLDNSVFDPADGPAVFIILFAGFLVVAAALIVEVRYQPPYWLHFVMWMPLGLVLPLFLLRPFKGVLVALQYKHKAEEGRLDDSD